MIRVFLLPGTVCPWHPPYLVLPSCPLSRAFPYLHPGDAGGRRSAPAVCQSLTSADPTVYTYIIIVKNYVQLHHAVRISGKLHYTRNDVRSCMIFSITVELCPSSCPNVYQPRAVTSTPSVSSKSSNPLSAFPGGVMQAEPLIGKGQKTGRTAWR